MRIITVPHSTLRQKAARVEKVDKRLLKFIAQLSQTLSDTHKGKVAGVGLAAPQVDKLLSVFSTYLPDTLGIKKLRIFINPTILDHSDKQILGAKASDKEPRDEGCLSIPGLWGPVPRWEWASFGYQVIENGVLVDKTEHFKDFPARVMLHEYDHLHGVLFTDYSLKYDLPVLKEVANGEYEEVDKRVLESW